MLFFVKRGKGLAGRMVRPGSVIFLITMSCTAFGRSSGSFVEVIKNTNVVLGNAIASKLDIFLIAEQFLTLQKFYENSYKDIHRNFEFREPARYYDSVPKQGKQVEAINDLDGLIKIHSAKKAAIRSAMLPGLGQVYNRKYWKVPVVYGALGITGAVFINNVRWYEKMRFAYKVSYLKDTASYAQVDWRLRSLVEMQALNSLRSARNEFRKNVDYSALIFILGIECNGCCGRCTPNGV